MKKSTKIMMPTVLCVLLTLNLLGQVASGDSKKNHQPGYPVILSDVQAPSAQINVGIPGEVGDYDGPGLGISSAQSDLKAGGGPESMSFWVLPQSGSANSGLTRAPGNTFLYQRTKYLVTPSNMAVSGFPSGADINSIGFRIHTEGVGTQTGTLNVFLMNTSDVNYSLGNAWDVSLFTLVSSIPSFTVPITPTGLIFDVVFTGGSPFVYSGGGVYVAWEFISGGSVGSTAVIHACDNLLASSVYGARSNVSLPTTLTASSFRPATRFGTSALNDIVAVTNIYAVEKVPVPFGNPTEVRVRVENVSSSPVSFDLTLEVRDQLSSILRHTATQNVSNLPGNSSSVVSFQWNPTIVEAINITAFTSTIPGESWTANNTMTIPANINPDRFSYFYSDTPNTSVGFAANVNSIMSARYFMNAPGTVNSARVIIGTNANNPGNTVYAVLINSAGTTVAQSADYIIQTGDLGNPVTFSFPTPVTFADEFFYVGLAQTYLTGSTGYFPMGGMSETPPRGNTFFYSSISEGTLYPSQGSWKYMIEAIVNPAFQDDVGIASIDMAGAVDPGTVIPLATVRNYGTNTQTFNVTMTISPAGYSSTKTVASLTPGATFQVAFDPWVNSLGVYTVEVCAQLAGDQFTANDCQSKAITVLELGKQVYGYNVFTTLSGKPEGPVSFYINYTQELISLDDQSAEDFISGGTWANGVWYGVVRATGDFITIDPITGSRTLIGNVGPYEINGLSYNPANDIMYAVGHDQVSNSQLYTIEMATGAATFIGDCGPVYLINLAINNAGQAYSVDIVNDVLGTLNLSTGAYSVVGSIGFDANFAQGMEFDRDNGLLYMAAYPLSGGGWLGLVNTATGFVTKIDDFESGAEISGFAIPYVSGHKVSGNVYYGITGISNPMTTNTNISLNTFGTTSTELGGYFEFTDVSDGSYNLTGNSSKPHGGLQAVDAILVQRFISGSITFTDLQKRAADVNMSVSVQNLDATLIRRRIGDIAVPQWTAPDWIFDGPFGSLPALQGYPVNVSGSDVTVEFRVLCSGDVNGSYNALAK